MSTKLLSTEDTITISRLEYESLKAELAELKRLIFSSKSERFIPTDCRQATLLESQPEQDT